MASIRRNTGAMQREGSVKNCTEFDPSPSPKLSYSQSYVAMRGLLNSLVSLDFVLLSSRLKTAWAAIASHRHPRTTLERSKSKGINWKRVLFHLFVCFMIGIFIGFTPFFSVDISEKIASENERLPFDEGIAGNGVKKEPVALQKEFEEIDEPQQEESPPDPVVLDEQNDSVEAVYIEPPFAPALNDSDIVVRKLLIIVTVTSVRPHQAYYLNRLAHVLKVAPPPLLWIVVEWPYQSSETAKILRDSGVMYRHLICNRNTTSVRKINVCQKNVALFHIKKHHLDGIVHFADEERVYLVDLFEEMQQIRRFGTWPVAIHTGTKYRVVIEGPICNGNQVRGWHLNQRRGASRRFPIGFSAFAFNSTMLWDPVRWHRPTSDSIIVHSGGRGGLQESRFVEKLVKNERQMQGLADNCTRIMVWNFNLEAPQLNYPTGWTLQKNLEVVVPIT